MSSIQKAAIFFSVLAFMLISAIASFAETINYTYDDMLRLIKAQYGDGTVVDYAYDNLSNRLIKTTTLPGAPANNPPNAASNPTPAHSGTNISTTPTLTWTGGDPNTGDALVYSVYFGSSSTPPLVATGFETNYSPSQLQSLTTYYWKVVARDNRNSITEGPLWSFTTKNDLPVASFVADRLSGWTPMKVTFTDSSQSLDDDIVSWAWDFNGDGITDSADQNPSYTYSSWGSYTVRLTVTDLHGASATATMPAYINVYDDEHVDENTIIHCVADSAELQSALTQAEGNGKNDVIRLVQETYGISGNNNQGFSYVSSEPYKLFIKGGYAPSCTSREMNPDNTILDGENIYLDQGSVSVMKIDDNANDTSYPSAVSISLDGISIKNSNSSSRCLYISSNYGNVSLNNNILKNNTNVHDTVSIYVSYGDILIYRNVIYGNVSTGYGTTVVLDNFNGNIDFISNIMENNTVNDIYDSVLDAYTENGNLNVSNNIIRYNNTKRYSGGIIISYAGHVKIASNLIADNYSEANPGGLNLHGYYGSIDLINNTIVGNTVWNGTSGYAGGLYVKLENTSTELNLNNNIFRDNAAAVGADMYLKNEYGRVINAFHNDFNPTKVYGTFTTQGNNLNVDPLFVNAATGDYRLKPASPVRDMGSNTAPSLPATDILGNPRISGAAVDIGAYEFISDGDDDDDQMPDSWETSHGLNPFDPSDAGQDADGDGLTNLQEYLAGTNPTNSDTDGDGVADGQDPYPVYAPTLTLSTASLYADESSEVTLTVSYLNGPSAVIEQLIDIDGDGMADAGEPVIRSFAVTDGTAATNPNVQGDEDGSSNGAVTTTLKFFNVLDRYHAPGAYVFRAIVGSAAPADNLSINSVSQSQTITGIVTDGTNPVPGAFVKLIDKWQRPVAYAVTNSLGQYLLNVNSAGDYYVVPEAFGYSAARSLIPFVHLSSGQQLTGTNLLVSQSGFSVSGQIYDNISGIGIRGVLVAAESAATLGLTMTDAAGNYQMPLQAGEYKVNVEMVDSASPSFKGYVAAPGHALTVNVSSNLIDIDFPLEQAAIQVNGRLLDDAGIPVTSLPIQASAGQATETLAFALTKSDGNFSLGLRQGSDWFISLEDSAAQSQGYIGSVIRNFSTSIGPLTGNDLIAYTVNAWIDGTVKNSANVPLVGVPVIVRDGTDSISASVSTASDGTYRLGVFAGNWYVRAATEVLGYLPTAEQSVLASVGQTITANFVAVNGGPGSYTISATSTGNGTLTPAGNTVVVSGTNQIYTFSPDPGHRVGSVLIDGVSTSTDGSSFVFDNVTADHTIVVNFVPDTFTITAIAYGYGTISPPGVTIVPRGGSQEYTFIPDANYQVQTVTVGGSSIGAPSSYTFTNVQSDQTIEATFAPVAQTLSVRVGASSDDAEEDHSSGDMLLDSSDLELIRSPDFGEQKVGMRFTGINIPQGATIAVAYLQFKVDETTSEETSLTIRGENVDNAAAFTTTSGDISSRPQTTSAVWWSPAPWTTVGEEGLDQRSPDIAPIIQEIVNRPGWSTGNALAFIIRGSGKRVAESFDGDQAGAPLLHVEFSTAPPPNQPPWQRTTPTMP